MKSCKNCIHISYTLLSHQHNDADSREGEYMGVKYDYFHRTSFEIKLVYVYTEQFCNKILSPLLYNLCFGSC